MEKSNVAIQKVRPDDSIPDTVATSSDSSPLDSHHSFYNKQDSVIRSINWWQLGGLFYGIGVLVFFIRLGVLLISLRRVFLRKNQGIRDEKFNLIEIQSDIAPFSFFNSIIYNPSLHTDEELHMILTHEKIHVRQYHTFDLLLVNILVIFQWINPFAWRYKKSMELNLEYIADKEAVNELTSPKQYQLALVNVSTTNLSNIANNFYQSLIKKRIHMLNKQPSKKRNVLKLGTILPLLALFLWSFNSKDVIKYEKPSFTDIISSTRSKTDDPLIHIKKENTRKELQVIQQKLKKEYGIKLIFDVLQYHNDLISKITMSFENSSGFIASYNDADTDRAITGITIILKLDKKKEVADIKFVTLNGGVTSHNKGMVTYNDQIHQQIRIDHTRESLFQLNDDSLYFINNKLFKKSEIVEQSFFTTTPVVVLLNDEAIERYGERAKNGVLIMNDAQKIKDIKEGADRFKKGDSPSWEYVKITKKSVEYGFAPRKRQ